MWLVTVYSCMQCDCSVDRQWWSVACNVIAVLTGGGEALQAMWLQCWQAVVKRCKQCDCSIDGQWWSVACNVIAMIMSSDKNTLWLPIIVNQNLAVKYISLSVTCSHHQPALKMSARTSMEQIAANFSQTLVFPSWRTEQCSFVFPLLKNRGMQFVLLMVLKRC